MWLDKTGNDQRNKWRNFGYHLRGMMPTNYQITVHGKRLSTISIMSSRGMEDFDTCDEAIAGDIFGNFIERCLVPILQPFNGSNARSVVVTNNAATYHVNTVINSIHNTGAIIRFLPPYSPDYNPLEESYAQVKSYLRANELAYDTTAEPGILLQWLLTLSLLKTVWAKYNMLDINVNYNFSVK